VSKNAVVVAKKRKRSNQNDLDTAALSTPSYPLAQFVGQQVAYHTLQELEKVDRKEA
jgi:hypothetical protein